MTEQELRDLDARIHREVFAKQSQFDMGELWAVPDGADCYGDESEPVPRYTTSVEAAWLVVEKLRGYRFELRRRHDGGFWAYLGEGMSAEAGTAPLAICTAALKAVETPRE